MRIALFLSRAGRAALRALAMLAVIAAAAVAVAATTRVSVDSAGMQANAGSSVSSLSGDGRIVTFASAASNLVAGDTNGLSDVFVHDRANGSTTRVSVHSSGAQAIGASIHPTISGDGGTVAFVSTAANLVAGDTNGRLDVFLHDRRSARTERVSVSDGGIQADSDSFAPSLSRDGQRVAFASFASNLVPGDTNHTLDVFVHDLASATTIRVSVDSAGVQANGPSFAPRLSADGLVVVFHSQANNLVSGDTNGANDVFVHDLATGRTSRISVGPMGLQGNFASTAGTLSADGSVVAFNSDANNLVPGDTNSVTDVFVHDRRTGITERVSVAGDGGQSNLPSGFLDPPSLSANGQRVAFLSAATNLVASDANNAADFFVRDRMAGTTELVSVASDGTQANGPSVLWATLSADGGTVVFASLASNLVASDTNFAQDVFVRASGGCGDGMLQPGEECDDGSRSDGDCCSADCRFESAGSACDDGNLCTHMDGCDGMGACAGAAPVSCPDADPCHAPATCDPTTGACASEPLPDGSACEDGDACSVGDACVAGACMPGALAAESCLDPLQCYLASASFGSSTPPRDTWLADAFGAGMVRVKNPAGLCTSAEVTIEVNQAGVPPGVLSPSDPYAMQTCFRVKSPLKVPPRSIEARLAVAENRAGQQTLEVERLSTLCLPAGDKKPPPGPPATCYAAKPSRSVERNKTLSSAKSPRGVPLKLRDRYRIWPTQMLEPEMLCTLAQLGEGPAVRDDVAWVCFKLKYPPVSWSQIFWPRRQRAATSFGMATLDVWRPERICMPSQLTDLGPAP